MKNIVKVSISGVAFIFDDDAYRVMRSYLDKLEAGYSKNPDGREIIADIEARIAELILSEQEGEQVVSAELAKRIVEQLGFPDDVQTGDNLSDSIPKRLYRNPEGAMIGGVCSGIGTYFRIDPVWVRLGVFAPLILSIMMNPLRLWRLGDFFGSLFGVFILLYIVLWIVVPMARTPRQKLEMTGEKITASSIKQKINEETQTVSSSLKSEKAASVWGDLMYGVGKVLQVLLKVFVIFFAFVFGIVAVSLFASLIALLFGGSLLAGLTMSTFAGFAGITPVAYVVMLIALVLIPIVIVIYLLIRLISGRKRKPAKTFLSVMGIVWLIILIFTTVATVRNADSVRDGVEHIIDYDNDSRREIEHDIDDWDEEGWLREWHEYTPNTAAPAKGQWMEEITDPK